MVGVVTLFTASGSLPRHQYVWVDGTFMGSEGWHPAVWFGLHSQPGRAWGCTILLECGAIYRDLPLHALAFQKEAGEWALPQAQNWDCYGWQFSLHAYDYLEGMSGLVRAGDLEVAATYLFTAIPVGDPYTHHPGQAKEFLFMRTEGGRITAQPTNRVLLRDASFTTHLEWPRLQRNETIYSCEK